MQLAIEAAKEGMAKGIGGPFGAVIVKNGQRSTLHRISFASESTASRCSATFLVVPL